MLDNPERLVSHGLNACVREATGDLVIRIDCHSRYPRNYVRRCVEVAEETGADNVGGLIVAQGRTPTQRAVASGMSSPFGGIGWTRQSDDERAEVDTVPFGAFRPDAFRRAGLFDESLVRNQDDEFNLRLRLAGGRIVLRPVHHARIHTPWDVPRAVQPVLRVRPLEGARDAEARQVVSVRSLAPVALLASFLVLTVLSVVTHHAVAFLAAEAIAYAAGAVVFGVFAVRSRGESWSLLPRVVLAFATIHLAYGLGMAVGWLRAGIGRVVSAPGALTAVDTAGARRALAVAAR